jgi:hypothetical protein
LIDSDLITATIPADTFIDILKREGIYNKLNHLPINRKRHIFADIEGKPVIDTGDYFDFLSRSMANARWYKTIYCPNIEVLDHEFNHTLKNLEKTESTTLFDLIALLYEINDLEAFMRSICVDDFSAWLKEI